MRWKKANIEDIRPAGGNGDKGADTSVPIAGKPTPLIKEVVSRPNMLEAYDRVVSNKGSAGVDGMDVTQLQNSSIPCKYLI